MGCFTILKHKKKKSVDFVCKKIPNARKNTGSTLPEPDFHGPSLQSAPPSFRNRTKFAQSVTQFPTIRTRALSAPSTLAVTDREALEFDDQVESRDRRRLVKDQHFSNPLPLPLPSPEAKSVLKNFASFKSTNASAPTNISGSLPLPRSKDGLRSFSYNEVSAACLPFSLDSEGSSSTVYRASFEDEMVTSKKIEATVSCLLHSSLVIIMWRLWFLGQYFLFMILIVHLHKLSFSTRKETIKSSCLKQNAVWNKCFQVTCCQKRKLRFFPDLKIKHTTLTYNSGAGYLTSFY